jgi:hypothetical protein
MQRLHRIELPKSLEGGLISAEAGLAGVELLLQKRYITL